MNRFPTRRAAATLAAVAGLVALTANPAAAVVRDVDDVRINSSIADFGAGPFINHAPSGSGKLTWDERTNTTGKPVTARLTGTVWWDDPGTGCALVRLRIYDTNNNTLATVKSAPACRVGSGGPRAQQVNVAVTSRVVHRAVVTTQVAASVNGPFTNKKSQVHHWGQINGVTD